MLDIKALLKKLLDAVKVDYITEEGTTGMWTYRKWKSGKYEAWGRYAASGLTLTTSSAGTFYGPDKTVSLPSWSKSCNMAWGMETASQSSGVYIYSIGTTATYLTVAYRAHYSQSGAVCNGMFFVIGTY